MSHYVRSCLRRIKLQLITAYVPRDRWYVAALRMSRAEVRVERIIRRNRKRRRPLADRLHSWILDLTPAGPYPLPLKVIGIDSLGAARAHGRGVLLCSTHIPLYDIFLPALARAGIAPDLVVAARASVVNGGYQVPAAAAGVPAVAAGPHALLSVRTKLRNAGLVVCLLDQTLGGPLFDNVLRLAGKLAAPVVFWSVALGADGIIAVTLEPAPFPLCDSEEAVRANLAAADVQRAHWRHALVRHAAPAT